MDDGNRLILKALQYYKIPVKQALVEVFSKTYTQDIAVYDFLQSSELRQTFTASELALLKKQKTPRPWPFAILVKVSTSLYKYKYK